MAAPQPGPILTSTNGRTSGIRNTSRLSLAMETAAQALINEGKVYHREQEHSPWVQLTMSKVLTYEPSFWRAVVLYVAEIEDWLTQGFTLPKPTRTYLRVDLDAEQTTEREDTMLERLLKLYTTAMATGVTSPMPHLIGPPGCGKSSVARQLADIVGVQLHTINVSRLSPLELEGVQMPDKDHAQLNLLHATFWTQLNDGDIVLFDEFLRGFPEVYNGLLDILTAREVGGLKLKKVFVMSASNSAVAYDKALEDRLLHIPVPDPRQRRTEQNRLAERIVESLGLHPEMVGSSEMHDLLRNEVLPMFEVLDHFDVSGSGKAKPIGQGNTTLAGTSLRKLIGQAQLREVQSPWLKVLLDANNTKANRPGKTQFMFLMSGKHVPNGYERTARDLVGNDQLSEVQRLNIEINLQLIEMENLKKTATEGEEDDSDLFI